MAFGKKERIKKWLSSNNRAFPTLLLVPLFLFTILRINGSSIGVYHEKFYGTEVRDPNLLYGHPRGIRSDEWLVSTQINISQSRNNFPKINPNLGSGRDVSWHPEIANTDWSTLFKPQNWAYFTLPLEHAFAFKWWFVLYFLIVTCYFFTLRLLPDRRMFAILFSLAIGLTPFVLWWYQTGIMTTLGFGFLMIILGERIIRREPTSFLKRKPDWLTDAFNGTLLAYIIACFGLTLYPPFQIPVGLVVAAYLVGVLLDRKLTDKKSLMYLFGRLVVLFSSVITAFGIGMLFIVTHIDTIRAMNNTIYPGSRIIPSGDLKILQVFDAFMMPLLQGSARAAGFFSNQSEASNFVLLLPFLLIPGICLIVYEYRRYNRVDWVFTMLHVCSLMFFARVFIPFGDLFYKFLFLHKVPNKRLLIGFGFVGIVLILLLIKKIQDLKLPINKLRAAITLYCLGCFGVLTWLGYYTMKHYPLFIKSPFEIIILAGAFTGLIFLLLIRKPIWFGVAFLIFSAGSSFRIVPLYRGFGPIYHTGLIQKMDAIAEPSDTWVSVDDIYYENLGILVGNKSFSGVQLYPDVSFWEQNYGKQYEVAYNRKGHAVYTIDDKLVNSLQLVQSNLYKVGFACSDFTIKNIDFVLATNPINTKCTKLVDEVKYPRVTFYIYEIVD